MPERREVLKVAIVIDPKASPRRRRWEWLIWVADMIVYTGVAIAGIAALCFTSTYVLNTVNLQPAVVLWSTLLLAGGLVGLAGRLSRRWAIELPGNVAAATGTAIYAVILVPAVTEGTSLVLFVMIVVAWIYTCRRYFELQILVSEPGMTTFRNRIAAALRRKTANVVNRTHY